jgi:hypothetical protein
MEYNITDFNIRPDSVEITRKILTNWDKCSEYSNKSTTKGGCGVCEYLVSDARVPGATVCRVCPLGSPGHACSIIYDEAFKILGINRDGIHRFSQTLTPKLKKVRLDLKHEAFTRLLEIYGGPITHHINFMEK